MAAEGAMARKRGCDGFEGGLGTSERRKYIF